MSRAGPDRPGPSNWRWAVFGLLSAGYFLVYFHRLAPAVMAVDLMRDLSAGGALMGLLASAYFYPYALMQVPTGLLSDSAGPRRTICLFMVLAGLGALLFVPAKGPGLAMVARTLVGLGVSTFFVCSLKLFTRWFAPSEFATMTGLYMAVGALGALCAGAPLAFLSSLLGWRASFGIIGLVTLAVTVGIWVVVRDDPRDRGLPPAEGLAEQVGASVRVLPLGQGLRRVFGSRDFWPCAVWLFAVSGTYFSVGGLWGGPYLRHVYGFSGPETGLILSGMSLGMLVGCPLASVLSDRVYRGRRPFLLHAAAGLTLLVAGLALFPHALGAAGMGLWFFTFGCLAGSGPVVAFSSVKELFPLEMAGTAMGLTNLFPFLGGAACQLAAGFVLESFGREGEAFTLAGYSAMFWFHAALMGAALLASLRMRETFRRA